MDTIGTLCQEMESILSGINAAGLKNMDPGVIDKIEKIGQTAEKFLMKTGKKLCDNLVASLKSFQEGKSDENSVTLRMTAIDFYIKKVLSEKEDDIKDL